MVEETQKETLEKKKALENALTSIERRFGKGSIMPLKRAEKVKVEVIPTGSLALDIATGIGGIPKGRVIEIYGAYTACFYARRVSMDSTMCVLVVFPLVPVIPITFRAFDGSP